MQKKKKKKEHSLTFQRKSLWRILYFSLKDLVVHGPDGCSNDLLPRRSAGHGGHGPSVGIVGAQEMTGCCRAKQRLAACKLLLGLIEGPCLPSSPYIPGPTQAEYNCGQGESKPLFHTKGPQRTLARGSTGPTAPRPLKGGNGEAPVTSSLAQVGAAPTLFGVETSRTES